MCPAQPATVVTAPPGVITRTVPLPESTSYSKPLVPIASALGEQNRGTPLVPSTLPVTPALPANVVTTPLLVAFRIVEFWESATYMLPVLSTATPDGPQNRAALFVPSALPYCGTLPASVVTTPALVTVRMVSLL